MLEVKVYSEINKRLEKQLEEKIRDLKMLNTVIRLPKLCHDYQ